MWHRLCVYTQDVVDSHAPEACEKLRVVVVKVRQLNEHIHDQNVLWSQISIPL